MFHLLDNVSNEYYFNQKQPIDELEQLQKYEKKNTEVEDIMFPSLNKVIIISGITI